MTSYLGGVVRNVASLILDRFLKPYVDNWSSDKLKIGLYSGSVQLTNLKIKKGALDNLHLPIDVAEGRIGEINLTIPVSSIGSKPVIVVVEDVYILAVPAAGNHFDPEENEKRAQAAKQERLANAELIHGREAGGVTADAEKNQGVLQALIAKVANNVQIHVKNIHIRYEDNLSCPDHPFAAGVTLAEFSVQTTDADWQPAFLQSTADAIHKLASLRSLAVYFNTDEDSIANLPQEQFITAFHSLIAHDDYRPPHQYALQPVTGEARMIINHNVDKETPRFDVQVMFQELGFTLDDNQYRDAISMVDMYHFYVRQAQYRQYRPSKEEMDANPRLALLKFAGEAIRREVHEKRRQWSWEYFKERRDQRHSYVRLYKIKQNTPTMTGADFTAFNDLETHLSYDDIRFYRSIAKSQLRTERAEKKKKEVEEAKHKPAATGGWLSYVPGFGGGGHAAKGASDSLVDEEMTDAQRKELYNEIGYNEKAPLDLAEDALKLRVTAELKKGSFRLRKKPEEPGAQGTEVISVVFDSSKAVLYQRVVNMEATLTLGGFSVFDGTLPGTLHHKIVRVKEEKIVEVGVDDEPTMSTQVERPPASDKDALLFVNFIQNPPDGHADSSITVRMKAMEIVYHKGYVEAIFTFFRPPESQLESVGALLSVASETLGELRKQSRAGLEYALATHKTVDIKLDMKSPIIIIPEDVKSKSGQHMVLDAGHISIQSDLVPKSELYDIHSKRKRKYTEEDYEKLESLMYDRFFLKLESAQLVLGNDLDSCLNALTATDEGRELHLLERINMEFSVQNSIIPDAPNLTKFKVAGKLPSLTVNFSNMKYKGMMRLIDISIPKFGDDNSSAPAPTVTPARPDAFKLPSGFFRSEVKEYVIDDGDHSTIADGDGATDDDTFVDADAGSVDINQAAIRQHIFEFAFQVEKLQASLYKSTGDGPEKLLADVVLERFALDFALAQYDMHVKLALRSLSLHMVDGLARRIPLVLSSRESGITAEAAEAPDLVQVQYTRVQANSPEFMTVYEGIDQSVTVGLSTFIVHAAPEPILTLYDFIMSTFVPGHPGSQPMSPPAIDSPQATQQPAPQTSSDSGKIRVRVNLTTIELVLIDENNKLAALALSSAEVAVFLRGNTMRISARLGSLSLADESSLVTATPSFKKIISIEGEELADFTYETFDPLEKDIFPGVNSSVQLRVASLQVVFLEEPVRDIYHFMVKFARMKSLYDAATQAAVQRAAEITKMKFDINVRSPVVIFPRDATQSPDVIRIKLGEIFASNSYSGSAQKITAGLRGISVTSRFFYEEELATLRIVEDVDISSTVVQTSEIDRKVDLQRPDTAVEVTMSDVKVSLTQAQYILLIEILQAIPRVLATADHAEEAAEKSAAASPAISRKPSQAGGPDSFAEATVDMVPELGMTAHADSGKDIPRWSSVDVVFSVKTLRLQLFDKHATRENTLKESGIARFSLNDNVIRFKMLSDGSTQTEVILKSFTVGNTRAGNSRFREMIPAAQHDRNQFMVLFTTTGGSEPSSSAVVSIDSPKVIFTIDPVFALMELFLSPFSNNANAVDIEEVDSPAEDQKAVANSQPAMSLRVDLHDVSISLLEKDDDPNTQAIQLTIKEILMSQQGILALSVNQMGMSLMSMNKPSEKVSFLDDLDITLAIDNREPTGREMTSIDLTIQPIIFRASLRDINLIMAIVNRGIELSSAQSKAKESPSKPVPKQAQSRSVKSRAKSSRSAVARPTARSAPNNVQLITSKEKLDATFDGFRLVLIGDVHEFPLLHLNTKAFTLTAKDWSSELQANATFGTSITYWNLTNSHWEPLIDPWTFSVSARKDALSGALTTTFASQERLDVNITTTFVELALTTASVWSKEGDRVMKKGRGGDAPYRIINRTGTPLQVWSEVEGSSRGKETKSAKLQDNSDIDWRFDDWKTMRERVSSSRNNSIAIQFEGKPWEPVHNIPVDREGEFVYALRPRVQKVADRLLCEVTVKDNVKIVTLRSTYKLENQTLYPIDVILVGSKGKPTDYALQKLAPGQDYCVPIEAVLTYDIQVCPDPGFGYTWPDRPIKWQDFVKSPARTISCPFKGPSGEVPFRFQGWALFDANDAINRTYPKMTVRLRAPIELENLLPFDIRYTIYDKDSHKKWRSYLRRGGLMPIHCVHLDQFVLFNVEIQDTNYKPSEFSIINTDDSPDFSIESTLRVADLQDRKLDLGINYVKHEDSGGAFRMQVYSPFVVINKTGFPLNIKSANGRAVAGQVDNAALSETVPFMFSHPREQGADFMIRLGDSVWSKVLNFDAPSAETTAALSTSYAGATKETHLGVSWTSGLGKYKLTKVVTVAPRFMLKNELPGELLFRECGDTTSNASIRAGQSNAIFAFSPGREPALSIKYPGVDCDWTAPINVQNIGVVHIRINDKGKPKPDLARVDVSIGGATVWVTVKLESGGWPFTIENGSDHSVLLSQTDERQNTTSPTYTLKSHSQMPYAWDAPAARDKKLKLQIQGVARVVDIMEIGDLVPFRFRTPDGHRVVSLDVRADGPTQVLSISNYSEETSLYRRRARSATIDSTVSRQDTMSSQSETAFEAVTEEIAPSMSVNVDFDGIGLSLINRRLVEVVYLTLSKLKIEYTDSDVAQTLNVACGWIQIDNQLHEAIYPIVLQPMMVAREGNALDVLPSIQASLIVLKDQSHGVLFVKYASVLLQALSVQMDEDFLFALLDLTKFQGVSWETEEADVLTEYPVELPPARALQEGQDLYFEVLELQPMRLSISFTRTERVNADEKLTLRNPLAVVLNAFTMTLGNVNDAPLRLNALAIKDMRLTVPVLQERIIYHYRQEVVRQVYRILGSADFIGNPVGLFNNVSSGVADIFYEPYKGVVMHGSKELGIGIAKGAASFAKKTVFGVTDSMTKVTSSIGKGLSAATFDAEYQRQRRLTQRKNRPGNAIYGVAAGAEALATSFSSGLEGVVMKPLEGAEREGAFGFFKGVGKGLVGAITKPAVGVFDLASNFTEGIRNTTTVFDNNQRNRKRIPRHTPADGILTPYSQREAVGQAWMKDLDGGKYRSESYVAHIELPGNDTIVMLTTNRVIAFSSVRLRLRWDLPFSHIEKVAISDTGITFADKGGREYDQFVGIRDASSKNWFFQEIEKVIKQWNASRRVER